MQGQESFFLCFEVCIPRGSCLFNLQQHKGENENLFFGRDCFLFFFVFIFFLPSLSGGCSDLFAMTGQPRSWGWPELFRVADKSWIIYFATANNHKVCSMTNFSEEPCAQFRNWWRQMYKLDRWCQRRLPQFVKEHKTSTTIRQWTRVSWRNACSFTNFGTISQLLVLTSTLQTSLTICSDLKYNDMEDTCWANFFFFQWY